MFIRFVDLLDDTDGHSVILYKYQSNVWTFQAYLDVTCATFTEGDIFQPGGLMDKLMTLQPINLSEFGVGGSACSNKYRTMCKCSVL